MLNILPTEKLLPRLKELLATTTKIHMAMAWAGGHKAPKLIIDWAARQGNVLQTIVGTTGTATSPEALRGFLRHGKLQLRPLKTERLFHPKLLIFHGNKTSFAWVGSANLTDGGFGANTEAVIELSGDISKITKFFNALWKQGRLATEEDINEYEETRRDRLLKREASASSEFIVYPSDRLDLLLPDAGHDWPSYLHALHDCDTLWHTSDWPHTIYSGEHNYLTAIGRIRSILAGLTDAPWDRDDIRQIFGYTTRNSEIDLDARYVLGAMHRPYNRLLNTLTSPSLGTALRRRIVTGLASIRNAEPHRIPDMAEAFINGLRDGQNTGLDVWPSVSTRLLAITRPDVCVSSNRQSRTGLRRLFLVDRKVNLVTGAGYAELLRTIQTRPWWKSNAPPSGLEHRLWQHRAALLDAFVYDWP